MKKPLKKPLKKQRHALLYVRVPILAEEYAIHVFVGLGPTVLRAAHQKLRSNGVRNVRLEGSLDGNRGIAWNCLPDHNPIIGVRIDLSGVELLGTLAHEASHAMGHIARATDLDDDRGEFRAHGVGAVMRLVSAALKRRLHAR